MFEAWISLNQALQTEYDLHRSLFNYWIYTNTEINGLQFAPYGFEYCDGEKVVTYFVAKNQKKIKHLSLEQANIAIESPTKLYHKLGIINLDTL